MPTNISTRSSPFARPTFGHAVVGPPTDRDCAEHWEYFTEHKQHLTAEERADFARDFGEDGLCADWAARSTQGEKE